MGFGLLFIGYFLLLNLTNPGYTDIVAGLITVMAFYKLSNVNKYFRMNIVPSVLLSVFGAFELFAAFADSFGINMTAVIDYLNAPRYLLVGIISAVMLLGIEDVANEVSAIETKFKAKIARPISLILFPVCAILEFPAITGLIPNGLPIFIVGTATLICTFLAIIYNLITVYSAYMHICMPEDVDNSPDGKPSRFEFVNRFRKHEEEKQREYQEYKIEKMKKKAEKKRRK